MTRDWEQRLKQVTWGYRDKFLSILKNLENQGYLDKNKTSRSFKIFDNIFKKIINKNYTFDVVLEEFLLALNENISWVLSRPALLEDWGEYGLHLLEEEWYYARKYFHIWEDKENLNITDPQEFRFIMTTLRSLEQRGEVEIALAFLEGYGELRKKLNQDQIYYFIEEGKDIYNNNPDTAELFFKLELSSAYKTIERLTTDCTLEEVKPRLQRLLKSFGNKEIEINDFSSLDSDELFEKGSEMVALSEGLYFPRRVQVYDSYQENQEHYLALTYISALNYLYNSFSQVHGIPGYQSLPEYIYNNIKTDAITLSYNLFFVSEVIRVLEKGINQFPRLIKYIKKLIKIEYQIKPLNIKNTSGQKNSYLFEKLIYRALYEEYVSENKFLQTIDISSHQSQKIEDFYQYLKNKLKNWHNFKDILQDLIIIKEKFKDIFGYNLDINQVRTLIFFPDYRYRAQLSTPPEEKTVYDASDKNNEEKEAADKEEKEQEQVNSVSEKNGENMAEEEEEKEGGPTGYFYDEWNHEAQDYYNDWCCLNEIRPHKSCDSEGKMTIDYHQVEQVKKIFEKIEPDLMRKEKNLTHGDDIVIDSLIRYYVEKEAGYSPYHRVYSKFFKNIRDIAVSLLVDVSGSTGEEAEQGKVLEVEKKAAFTMAEGLQNLGDKFGIFGFSGAGRDNCRFYVFKDFAETWGDEQKQNLYNIRPDSSTRIGVAIRHNIEKFKDIDAQKKIIMVITDGKPQDNDGYSPDTMYAQYDVRKACLEALKEGIKVFGLSTESNSLKDLEIMFPHKSYMIIPDIKQLPRKLADFYVKLTA